MKLPPCAIRETCLCPAKVTPALVRYCWACAERVEPKPKKEQAKK